MRKVKEKIVMAIEKSITDKIEKDAVIANLIFIGGRMNGTPVPINRETFFIGRSQNNNLALDDRSVSRKQAVINYMDGHFIISDLNSYKGTCVNGEKIHEVQLKNGDRIKLGDILLEFQIGKEAIGVRKKFAMPVKALPFVLLVLVVAGLAAYLIGGNKKGDNKDTLRAIEYNYSQGIIAYNVEKNVEAAVLYWQKVAELDPAGKTEKGRNARILLNSLSTKEEDK